MKGHEYIRKALYIKAVSPQGLQSVFERSRCLDLCHNVLAFTHQNEKCFAMYLLTFLIYIMVQ